MYATLKNTVKYEYCFSFGGEKKCKFLQLNVYANLKRILKFIEM